MFVWLWLVAVALRFVNLCFHYLTKDPFGNPIVARVDRFLPFASVVEIGSLALIVGFGAWLSRTLFKNTPNKAWLVTLVAVVGYLVLGVIDLEVMRYTKQHLSLPFLAAFFSPKTLADPTVVHAASANLVNSISTVVLGLLPLILALVFWFVVRRRIMQPARSAWLLLVVGLVGAASPWWLNPTQNRRDRILTPLFIVPRELYSMVVESWFAPDPGRGLVLLGQYAYDSEFAQPNKEFPLFKSPLVGDSVGHQTKIVLIVGETYKGLLFNRILSDSSLAPNFYSLTKLGGGRWFTHAYSNGYPSTYGAVSLYLGVLNHPIKLISNQYISNRFKGFPEYLKDWTRWMVNGADPYFDNQAALLSKYYPKLEYRTESVGDLIAKGDEYVFGRGAQIADSLPFEKSWLLTLNTISTHAPYEVDPAFEPNRKAENAEQAYLKSMAYSDAQFGKLLVKLRQRPDFNQIVFVVIGDHSNVVLAQESSYTDFFGGEKDRIFWGIFGADRSRLGDFKTIDQVVSQIDLAPTILAIAGIKSPNHFVGRNLMAQNIPSKPALFYFQERFALHTDSGSWLGDLRSHRVVAFDPDRLITTSIDTAKSSAVYDYVNQVAVAWKYLLNQNKVWPK